MATDRSFLALPDRCPYLPDQFAQLRYEVQTDLTAAAFMTRLQAGWRRFGPVVFRHECPSCRACQSLRIPVSTFRPSASQRRVHRRNAGEVDIRIASPSSSAAKLALFRRFHQHGQRTKAWPQNTGQDLSLFLRNPYPTEEWSYFVGDRLVGVGYVDDLPAGLSAIYFFHEPEEGKRSLGTYNILKMIDAAAERGLPHVYLGYYVEGCRSLEYKARFAPNEVLRAGRWERSCDAVAVPRPADRHEDDAHDDRRV